MGTVSRVEFFVSRSSSTTRAALKLLSSSRFRFTSAGFLALNAKRVQSHKVCIVINSVNNPIRTKDDFANHGILVLRHDTIQLWEFLQSICLGNEIISEGH
jgi:hypothetical protein